MTAWDQLSAADKDQGGRLAYEAFSKDYYSEPWDAMPPHRKHRWLRVYAASVDARGEQIREVVREAWRSRQRRSARMEGVG